MLASISALLLSFSGRPWGTPYLALFALVPTFYALSKERNLWVAGIVSYITALPIIVVGFEGLVVEAPTFFFLATLILSAWFFIPGAIAAWFTKGSYPAVPLWLFVLSWVAAETVAGSYVLWKNWAYPLNLGLAHVSPPLLSLAYWSGASTLSAAILAINLSLFLFLKRKRTVQACLVLLGVVMVSFATQVGLELSSSGHSTDKITVGVAQGTVSEFEFITASFSALKQERIVERYSSLTNRLISEHPETDFVVWPEGAAGYYFNYFGSRPEKVSRVLPDDTPLIAGAYDGNLNGIFYWNTQDYGFVYHKEALVPFFESFLTAGKRYTEEPIRYRDQKIGLGVCWESLYPELSRQSVMMGANLLLYLSDDTFAGKSVTPWHHAQSGAVRAVESGRHVVFASQSGPSVIFNPAGKMTPLLAHGERGYGVSEISLSKATRMTPYYSLGNWFGWGCVALVGLLCLLELRVIKRLPSTRR